MLRSGRQNPDAKGLKGKEVRERWRLSVGNSDLLNHKALCPSQGVARRTHEGWVRTVRLSGGALEDESGTQTPLWFHHTYQLAEWPKATCETKHKEDNKTFPDMAIKGSNTQTLPALEEGRPAGKIPGALLSTSNPKRQIEIDISHVSLIYTSPHTHRVRGESQ